MSGKTKAKKKLHKIPKVNAEIEGDIVNDVKTLEKYSHDTSLFEVVPSAVIFPKNVNDVKTLVKYVSAHKKLHPELSLTARSGGTDMSGGAINDGWIIVMDKYLNHIGAVYDDNVTVQPGAYYRDMEKKTLAKSRVMPSYPASKDLCAVGGIVANNSGGEKSLTYGKTEKYVRRLKVVLSDGNEYEVKPLTKKELDRKMAKKDFEGKVYRGIFKLVDKNYTKLKKAKPNVSKNSTGYKLWDIWDRGTKKFDLTQLFVGSQGTLGIITEIEFGLVPAYKHSGVLVGYARSLDSMGEIIKVLRAHNPVAIEAFDEYTLKFAFRFFLQFREGIGWWGLFKLAISLIPDAFILMRGIPKMIFMASYESDDLGEIKKQLNELEEDIKVRHFKITTEQADNEQKAERFWLMRRKSFALLRKNVKDKHTAPFIDDLVVPPETLPEFWPRIKKILAKYDLLYTIAGHLGDGNFHIIPLMDLTDPKKRAKIEPCLKEVIELVQEYGGVISGEHNDGLIRSPFLEKMYGKDTFKLFADAKKIMDPDNIFNPHKKTDADWNWSKKHIRDHF